MDIAVLRQRLAQGPLVSDGAWGTELQKRGLAAGECPDLWDLERPEVVGEVARTYREAGSEIVLTNTFRANRIALRQYNATDRVRAINTAGVEISRQNAPGALVFASVGPSGKLLVTGDVGEDELFEAFSEQVEAQAAAGADAILIETMSDIAEAAVAVGAARATSLPVIVSFSFDSGRNGDRTMTGATPEQCAAIAVESGAAAVGANCGISVDSMPPVCRRLHAASGLPVWAKPNAGVPVVNGSGVTYSATPASFASHVPALLEAGSMFVGGCCGTDASLVRAIAAMVHP
jgi:methionine synthase I (cobalamin-dependent)